MMKRTYITLILVALFSLASFFAGKMDLGRDSFDVPLLEDLSEKGNVEAMYALATLKKYGIEGVSKNHDEAISLFRRACSKKSEDACLELGWILIVSDTHNDINSGVKILEVLSHTNNEASFRLARHYKNVGDAKKSRFFAQRALEQGHHNHEYINDILSR